MAQLPAGKGGQASASAGNGRARAARSRIPHPDRAFPIARALGPSVAGPAPVAGSPRSSAASTPRAPKATSPTVLRLTAGASLPANTRARMESSFGRPFSEVRVHTDAVGAALAQQTGAEAVTVGKRVAFSPGNFRPESSAGDHLIAHELAHVAQHGSGPSPTSVAVAPAETLATGGSVRPALARLSHSQPSERAEVDAEQAANAVSRGENVHVAPGTFNSTVASSGLSTRTRLMRQARAGALPSAVVETPVPGSGSLGSSGAVTQEDPQQTPTSPDQSGVFPVAAAADESPPAPAPTPAPVASSPAMRLEPEAEEQAVAEAKQAEKQRVVQTEQAQEEQAEDKQTQTSRAGGTAGATAMSSSTDAGASAGSSGSIIEQAQAQSAPQAPAALVAAEDKDRAEVRASEAGAEARLAETLAAVDGTDAAKKDEKAPTSPDKDPSFNAVIAQIRAVAFQQGHNNPAERKVAEMQAAVADPANAAEAKAKGAHVAGPMAEATPAPFNRAAFEDAVWKSIEGAEPSSPEKAANYRVPGSVGAAAATAMSSATATAAGPVAGAAAAAPSAAGVTTQAGSAVPPMPAGPEPAEVGAQAATPKARGTAEVEEPLREPGQAFETRLSDSGFSEETFQNSNEAQLTGVLTTREEATEQTEQIISDDRAAESATLEQERGKAVNASSTETGQMHSTRARQFSNVVSEQQTGKTQEERTRSEVNQKLSEIYERTKSKVDDKLAQVDSQVNAEFDRGLAAATAAYEDYTRGEVDSWFNYFANLFSWTEFKNRVYTEGRNRWRNTIKGTISSIASIAASGLNEAHQLSQQGAQEARTWFEKQPAETQRLGQEAFGKIQSQFDELQQSVQARGEKLVSDLAERYRSALKELDQRIEADKAANLSIWEKAAALLEEGLALLEKMKEMLLSIGGSAAAVIDQILSDPIGFLGTLIEGIGQGLNNFVNNIGTHLQKGLMGWLLGQLPPDITLPETFDLKSIITLGLQILGLTYANFRARAVAIVGEPIVGALETAAEVFLVFMREGPAGLWRFIQEQLANLKDMVLGAIKDFIVEKIVVAGITWVLSLLNPASALVRAIKMIIDIVMFFINRGSQIMQLVQAVIGSLAAIAGGNAGAVAAAVENALARAIPVALSFLASLLGLGGIAAKIQSILEKVRAPINRAIDWVINLAVKVVKAAGKLIGGLFGGRPPAGQGEATPSAASDPTAAAKVDAANAFIDAQEAALGAADEIDSRRAKQVAAAARANSQLFRSISVEKAGPYWNYKFTVNPPVDKKTKAKRTNFPNLDVYFNPHLDWEGWFLDEGRTLSVREDYLRQLRQQEAGINRMTVGDWQAGRTKFKQFKLTRGSGRDPASRAAQSEMRRLLQAQIVEFLTSEGVDSTDAEQSARLWSSLVDVTHDPDQVAAGNALTFNRRTVQQWQSKFENSSRQVRRAAYSQLLKAFGLASANRSIGAQWVTKDRAEQYGIEANGEVPDKVTKIDGAVKKYMDDGGGDEDDRLLVTLHPKK